MLPKKLVTLAGALGILASGACFLPPPRTRRTPPAPLPPPRLDLNGIRSIHVIVVDESASRHFDTDAFARGIADAVNAYPGAAGIRADAGRSTAQDATLAVSIVNEAAIPEGIVTSPGIARWTFVVTIDATLTAQDGTLIWRETSAVYRSSNRLQEPESGDVWKSEFFAYWSRYGLSANLIARMFNNQ